MQGRCWLLGGTRGGGRLSPLSLLLAASLTFSSATSFRLTSTYLTGERLGVSDWMGHESRCTGQFCS